MSKKKIEQIVGVNEVTVAAISNVAHEIVVPLPVRIAAATSRKLVCTPAKARHLVEWLSDAKNNVEVPRRELT